jgi:hypothetical protein
VHHVHGLDTITLCHRDSEKLLIGDEAERCATWMPASGSRTHGASRTPSSRTLNFLPRSRGNMFAKQSWHPDRQGGGRERGRGGGERRGETDGEIGSEREGGREREREREQD